MAVNPSEVRGTQLVTLEGRKAWLIVTGVGVAVLGLATAMILQPTAPPSAEVSTPTPFVAPTATVEMKNITGGTRLHLKSTTGSAFKNPSVVATAVPGSIYLKP